MTDYAFFQLTDSGVFEIARLTGSKFTGPESDVISSWLTERGFKKGDDPTVLLYGSRLWAQEIDGSPELNLDGIRAGLQRHHLGPGPHPDGSPQSVHGGDRKKTSTSTTGAGFPVQAADLGSATARAEFDGSISVNPEKWAELSPGTKRFVMAHEIVHQTVEEYVLKNNPAWDRASDALLLQEKDGRFLFMGGNTRIGEAVSDAVAAHVVGDTFGREVPGWRDWADQVIKESGYSKNQLKSWTDDAVKRANAL